MAQPRKYGTSIDFENNPAINFVLDNVAGASIATYLNTSGKIAFDSTSNVIKYWNGTAIKTIATIEDVGSQTLAGLNDTEIINPLDAQVLIYTAVDSKWKNKSFSGDITITNAGVSTVGKLQGRTLTMGGSASFTFGITLAGNTSVTFPTTGTLATLGNAEIFSGQKTFTGGVVINSGISGTYVLTSGTGFGANPGDNYLASAKLIFEYVNQQTSLGISYRPPVDAIFNSGSVSLGATTNTVDGFTVVAGSRILVIDSSIATQDYKIYKASGTASNWSWAVEQDGTGSDMPTDGDTVWVKSGSTYADTRWTFTGTQWVQISGTGTYTASQGITISGNDIRHIMDDSWSHVQSGGANNQVLLYSAAASGRKGTWGLITNANIDASAAIAWSKLAAGTANQVVVTDGSGYLTTVAVLNVARGGTGASTFTQNGILYGNGTNAIAATAQGTANHFLKGNGASAPGWSSYAMPSSLAAGDILYASSTTVLSALTKGAANTVLGMNIGGTAPEYKTLGGTANRLNLAFAAGSITFNIDTNLLPSPLSGDAGKFLRASGANTAAWAAVSYSDLPNDVSRYYRLELTTANNTVSVTGSQHQCGLMPKVVLYRKDAVDTWRVYEVEVVIGASGNVTASSNSNWPAGSYLVITGR